MLRLVNKIKGSAGRAWDEASEFDSQKDKQQFRQYEAACDRVKNFYKEQHGELRDCLPDCSREQTLMSPKMCREANHGVQLEDSR